MTKTVLNITLDRCLIFKLFPFQHYYSRVLKKVRPNDFFFRISCLLYSLLREVTSFLYLGLSSAEVVKSSPCFSARKAKTCRDIGIHFTIPCGECYF